jgi:hypothetical protein
MISTSRRRRRLAVVAALAVAVTAPGTVSAAISFYVTRDMRGGESATHPTTRLWGTNYIANVASNATTRLWVYVPLTKSYAGDTGKAYGPLVLRAPALVPSKIYCQNWGSRTIPAVRCYGAY